MGYITKYIKHSLKNSLVVLIGGAIALACIAAGVMTGVPELAYVGLFAGAVVFSVASRLYRKGVYASFEEDIHAKAVARGIRDANSQGIDASSVMEQGYSRKKGRTRE